ncbi:hypothetical protein [Pedobacter sandarakinus]|uniref:hypothetical protein n=1 Tax=Pedobacter sandarakinus TaxID=353156 RepID=UPI002247E069|nr:hypothetical protein [Pedobacter sandarakinus]MCX2575134.1 hypothetical protein [Pedobacter sandarakinus]
MLSKYLLLCCLILSGYCAKAQSGGIDSVAVLLENYGQSQAQSSLFIHFDKNIYTNNDDVWFTGCLLQNIAPLDQYQTLYLSLVNNADSTILLQEKFLITEGFVFGAFSLPDSLPNGNYRFIANTNIKVNGHYDGNFVQPITIKSTTINSLVTNISVFKVYDEESKNGTALLRVLTGDNRFVENADVTYTIGSNDNVIQRGKAKTSVIGELMINYPAEKIVSKNAQLHVIVKKNGLTKHLNFKLPELNAERYHINFFPEGGYLVEGLRNKLSIELRDVEGNLIRGKVAIFEDGFPLDTIQTSAMGVGNLLFFSDKLKRYSAEIIGDSQKLRYSFPKALENGLALRINSPVVDGELLSQIESNHSGIFHVVVHDFNSIFLQTTCNLQANNAQNIRFKLDTLGTSLYGVTVLDQNFKPVAESLFFAHYNKLNRIDINLNKPFFSTRDSVAVSLNLLDGDGQEIKGLVSVSCAQSNRFSIQNSTNIADYAYFHQLEDLPTSLSGIRYLDREYLNDVLNTKGWRRYKWPSQEVTTGMLNISSMSLQGWVTKNGNALKEPIVISSIAGRNLNMLDTDSSGHFILPTESLLTTAKGKVILSLGAKNPAAYGVKTSDPIVDMKDYLTKLPHDVTTSLSLQLNDSKITPQNRDGITLKEVLIRTTDDKMSFASNRTSNSCGDYVCKNRIFNCQNHIGDFNNAIPKKGGRYLTSSGREIIYAGCSEQEGNPSLKIIKGINLPKEFYTSDIANMYEPINHSTIYWNYQLEVSEKGENKLTFTTGDLPGKYKIIVQGISSKGVVYGEKEFEVLSK